LKTREAAMNGSKQPQYDVAIVGGGLAGLTAAALLGRAGKSVVVYEQSGSLGGRAATQNIEGFHFNLGPHALYRGGHAMRVLQELGIEINEAPVGTSGATAVRDDSVYPLPVDFKSLIRSPLLTFSGRIEVIRFLGRIPRMETAAIDRVPLEQWLNTQFRSDGARRLIEALIRVSTYTNAPGELSAGAALGQFQTAFRSGVVYLSDGWQTLVDRLRDAATQSGTIIHTASGVHSLESISASAVVLAVPPQNVAAILGGAAGVRLLHWIETAKPVQAACLDLGLRRLPRPERTFSVGMDCPFYFSVHSRWAHLAPAGKVLVQAARYLMPGAESDPAGNRREIEHFLDTIQPGWRNEIEHQRFMPALHVTQALVRAADGGLSGRPAVNSAAVENVYLAGDWVGNEGMLSDTAFASAYQVAKLIVHARQPMLEILAV
jgi:phytoene dehydrogenase-like protein